MWEKSRVVDVRIFGLFIFILTNQAVAMSLRHFKMAAASNFWMKLERHMLKKSYIETQGGRVHIEDCCKVWVGCCDKHGYGRKRIKWPDGSSSVEGVHRVAYMLEHRLLKDQVDRLSAAGVVEVSHICNNKLCINARHLVLETHEENMSRNHCFARHGIFACWHLPACLLPPRL